MAEKALDSFEWSNCVLNAQRCLELSLKSLLEVLEIKYPPNHAIGLYPKTEEKLSEKMEKMCEKLKLKHDYEKVLIARAFVRALLWQGVRNIAQGFGPKGVAVKDLFRKEEAELAKSHAWTTYNLCSRHILTFKLNKNGLTHLSKEIRKRG